MDLEGAGDLADGFAFPEQALGERSLVFTHLCRPSEADAALPRVGAAGTGALADEVAFELGDAGEDGHDHLAGMGGGIGPGLGNGLEAGAGLADGFDDLKQVAGGAGQPVEFPDRDRITRAELVEHAVEFGPVAVGAGELFAKDALAAGLLECFELEREFLVFGRDAGVADLHSQNI